jgi:hypothetical protein
MSLSFEADENLRSAWIEFMKEVHEVCRCVRSLFSIDPSI